MFWGMAQILKGGLKNLLAHRYGYEKLEHWTKKSSRRLKSAGIFRIESAPAYSCRVASETSLAPDLVVVGSETVFLKECAGFGSRDGDFDSASLGIRSFGSCHSPKHHILWVFRWARGSPYIRTWQNDFLA